MDFNKEGQPNIVEIANKTKGLPSNFPIREFLEKYNTWKNTPIRNQHNNGESIYSRDSDRQALFADLRDFHQKYGVNSKSTVFGSEEEMHAFANFITTIGENRTQTRADMGTVIPPTSKEIQKLPSETSMNQVYGVLSDLGISYPRIPTKQTYESLSIDIMIGTQKIQIFTLRDGGIKVYNRTNESNITVLGKKGIWGTDLDISQPVQLELMKQALRDLKEKQTPQPVSIPIPRINTTPPPVSIENNETVLHNIFQYNNEQIKIFETKLKNSGINIWEGATIIEKLKKLHKSSGSKEISESIHFIKNIQKELGFQGDNINGRFDGKTQEILLQKLSTPSAPSAPTPVSIIPEKASIPLYLDEFLQRNTEKLKSMGVRIEKNSDGFSMKMFLDRTNFDITIYNEKGDEDYLDKPVSIDMQNALQQYSIVEKGSGVKILTIALGGGRTVIQSVKK